jgi:hypothetical protein
MQQPLTVDLGSDVVFHHVRMFEPDEQFARALEECITAQRANLSEAAVAFEPVADAEARVSEAALVDAAAGDGASDIRTDPELSNCLVFHTSGLPGSVDDPRIVELREVADTLLRDRLRMIVGDPGLELRASGHFWYPPGSYMGWHTNVRVPGWRAYVTYAAEPARSFFRYRDPQTGEVVTSWDDGWDLRVFRVDPRHPFWHSVYSGTDRYSFGYRLLEPHERAGA